MTAPGGRSGALAAYRGLLRLYPKAFREEYGRDMLLLFADQAREDGAVRVWTRTLIDVAVTVPTRHLEAHMNRPPAPAVPLLYAVIAVTGLFFAAVGGTSVAMLAIGLTVAAVSAMLAVVAWRRTRPDERAASPAAAHWWKFLAGGAGTLATVIAVTTATGELPSGWWLPTMLVSLGAVFMVATGLVLGIAHLATGRRLRTH